MHAVIRCSTTTQTTIGNVKTLSSIGQTIGLFLCACAPAWILRGIGNRSHAVNLVIRSIFWTI